MLRNLNTSTYNLRDKIIGPTITITYCLVIDKLMSLKVN